MYATIKLSQRRVKHTLECKCTKSDQMLIEHLERLRKYGVGDSKALLRPNGKSYKKPFTEKADR